MRRSHYLKHHQRSADALLVDAVEFLKIAGELAREARARPAVRAIARARRSLRALQARRARRRPPPESTTSTPGA
jgi:hypothetical protein